MGTQSKKLTFTCQLFWFIHYTFDFFTVCLLFSSRELTSCTASGCVTPSTIAHSWHNTFCVCLKKPAIEPYNDLCSPYAYKSRTTSHRVRIVPCFKRLAKFDCRVRTSSVRGAGRDIRISRQRSISLRFARLRNPEMERSIDTQTVPPSRMEIS